MAGECDHRSSISHPALDLFVNPPVRTLAWITSSLGMWDGEVSVGRHAIAIAVSPLAAALQTALVFLLCLELGLSRGRAMLASALASVSLSALLFGSIPESFALSGAAVAGAFVLAARAKRETNRSFARWLTLATFAAGVTITNLASIVVLYLAGRWNAGDDAMLIARRTIRLVVASVGITVALATLAVAVYDVRPLNLEQGKRYVTKWTENNDPVARLAHFPTAMVNSVAGLAPDLAPNYQGQLNDSRYKFRFSYETTPSAFSTSRPLALVLLCAAALGAWAFASGDIRLRSAAAASFAILLTNAILHAFWGVGHFLYSQHWQLAFTLFLIGPMLLPGRGRVGGGLLVLGITLAVVAQNWTVGRVILAHFSPPTTP
ncbi:MAG: hypothetical protein GY733_16975 [bacterium]|nr:hypothetical protein [bacterium]